MSEPSWDLVINAGERHARSSLKRIWPYRDLLWLLIRRDFVSFYKQTVLGPLWFFIKPVFGAIVYLFVFSELAGLSTDGIPPALFYISGLTAWSYFSETVAMTSDVLSKNADIFGKVYFPRLIMPLSIVFSNMIKLGIQVTLIFMILAYYLLFTDQVVVTLAILLVPIIVLIIAVQALGLGLLVAAVSTKYRDISMMIGYVLQLGLFITPVVYPLSSISGKFKLIASANPMTFPIELFRYSFFGTGSFPSIGLIYMIVITFLMLLTGVYAFNKAEKTFVDTV